METEQMEYVKSIKQSSEILLGVINDILEFSTLQNGKISFDRDPFDLEMLMSNMLKVMEYKKKEKPLQFSLHINPDVPNFLFGDKLRLNQIMYNLVGNAVKFTDSGFVKVTIEKSKDLNDKVELLVSVEDSGIGIPEDKQRSLFDPFTRVRNKNRIYEGTGLGLSITKNLVEQQNGLIGVNSTLG